MARDTAFRAETRTPLLTAPLANLLRAAVEARHNILISGGTGTGKTTLLNAVAQTIPPQDRIVLIEETSEILIDKPNLVRFEARRAQVPLGQEEPMPAVTIADLVRASVSPRHRSSDQSHDRRRTRPGARVRSDSRGHAAAASPGQFSTAGPAVRRFVVAAGSMKALLALGVLGVLPLFGYSLDVTRAAAFHFMAVGQLFLTYPSRHTWMRPLPNGYLHAAVIAGIGIQFAAASLPFTSELLGNAAIPVELWGVVFGGALLAWGLAEACARFAWRQHVNEGGGR